MLQLQDQKPLLEENQVRMGILSIKLKFITICYLYFNI